MTKYAYEYGKRWHTETPRRAIARAFTDAIKRECYRYAFMRHSKNRELYNRDVEV